MEWDVFICHASEDKAAIADALATALRSEGVRVWYDDFTLTIGDSLSQSINRGLSASSYGVIIVSPSFFAKEWPQKELDGLTALESRSGKTILPVWHGVDRGEVLKHSPVLADRLAVSTDDGLDVVVREILRALQAPALSSHLQTPSVSAEPKALPMKRPSGHPQWRVGSALPGALVLLVTVVVAKNWRDRYRSSCEVFLATPRQTQSDHPVNVGNDTVVDVGGTTSCEYVYVFVRPRQSKSRWAVTDQGPSQINRRWAALASLDQPNVDTDVVAIGCNDPACYHLGDMYDVLPASGTRLSIRVTLRRAP